MICPNCKERISKDDKFCGYCGLALKKEERDILDSKFLQPESTAQEVEAPLNCAGFWIRLGAWLIDYGILLILFLLFWFYFFGGEIFLEENVDRLVTFIALVVYHTFFLSVYSSTPGKMLYGLEVVDAHTKEKMKFGKALGRSLSYIISSLVCGLGFLAIAFDKEKHKGWHDKIAKTLVIRKKKKPLVLPIVLSVIAFCFLLWITLLVEEGYDFGYLGREASIIDSIQQKIYQQPTGFCCSYMSPHEIDYYLKEIPLKSPFKEEKNAEQIFEEFSKAVVTIGGETSYGEFSFGSGFLISPSGLLVTNYHVIEDMDKLAVALREENTKLFDVDLIVAKDPIKDIAVLKIEGQNLPHVVMGNSDLVKVGQKVFAIGNPEGFINTISQGIISQTREFEEGIQSFQITAPISLGSSGGALFNEVGEVIGITNLIFIWGENINFAIPINYVKELIGLKLDTSELTPGMSPI